MLPPGLLVVQITRYADDRYADEAHDSVADLAVVTALAQLLERRPGPRPTRASPPRVAPPEHAFGLLAEHLPAKRRAHRGDPVEPARPAPAGPGPRAARVPQRCDGRLGFGVSAAIGVKLGASDRPVVAALGCPARRVESYRQLSDVLAELLPTLAARNTPLLLDVAVAPGETYG